MSPIAFVMRTGSPVDRASFRYSEIALGLSQYFEAKASALGVVFFPLTLTYLSISAPARPGGGWLRGARAGRLAYGANRQAALPCRVEREPRPVHQPPRPASLVFSCYHDLMESCAHVNVRASRGEAEDFRPGSN